MKKFLVLNSLVGCAGLVAACSAGPGERQAEQAEALTGTPALSSFVVLARQSASFNDRSVVSGANLGVAAGSGSTQNTLSAGADARIGVGFDAFAQRVTLGNRDIAGNLHATNVTLGSNVTTGTRTPFVAPASVPVPTAAVVGTQNVTVAVGQVSALPPGRYGNITVNGSLSLFGGLYEARSLTVGNDASVLAVQPSVVRLATGISALDRSRITPGSGLTASSLTLEASGGIAGNDTLGVSIGNDARLTALVIASRGVRSGDRLLASGAIAAQSVSLGQSVSLSYQGGFACTSNADCGGTPTCPASCVDAQCQRPAACSVVEIAPGGDHACALMGDESAWCWGDNGAGNAGNGAFLNNVAPAPVVTDGAGTRLSGVRAVDVGGLASCAVRVDGTVWCWGSAPGGTTAIAVPVPGFSDATAISVGQGMICALLASGDASCIVNGTPTPVGLAGATAISAGGSYACALLSDRTVRCWGADFNGQLGDGVSGPEVPAPGVVVEGVSGAVALTTGNDFACALLSSGRVKCWGRNGYGEIGDGSEPVSQIVKATTVANLTDAVAIGSGTNNVCALRANGTVQCWARNSYGQLGDGDTNDLLAPSAAHPVTGLANAVSIGAGTNFSCASVRDGRAFCWGADGDATLGDGPGSQPDKSTPVQVHF